MSTIIPANNTSIITADCNDNYSNRNRGCNDTDHCGEFMTLNNRVSDSAAQVSTNDNINSHHQSANSDRIGYANLNAADRNGADTRTALRDEANETRNQARYYSASAERIGFKNFEATKDALKDVLISTKEDLKNVLISQKDDLRDLLISTKNDFKDLLLKNCDSDKENLLLFKDAQLVAMQNKCDLAEKIAECCCEQKELVREQANLTRELIRHNDAERLRDSYRDVKEELIALKMRASLLPPLAPAVSL